VNNLVKAVERNREPLNFSQGVNLLFQQIHRDREMIGRVCSVLDWTRPNTSAQAPEILQVRPRRDRVSF
jgi:hypothetical protein